MLKILHCDGEKLNIRKSEIIRYAGGADGKSLDFAVEKCLTELLPKISCKACYDEFDVKSDGETLDFGFAKVKSQKLAKNLSGCRRVVIFAATLGIETDRYLQKCSLISPASALIAQGTGAAAIEEWCDEICKILASEKAPMHLRPRFSPGYGGLSLSIQKDIISVLDCNRKIGLTLTDSLMLTPTKSVTAFVGLGENRENCTGGGCTVCDLKNCAFRKKKTCFEQEN